jgi:Protein of unknown function (DUF3501)
VAACREADVPESASFSLRLLEVFVTLEGPVQFELDDVRAGAKYEGVRGEERRRVGELKRTRRVRLGDTVALVFENRDSIRSTLEEALRTERVDDPDRVAAERAAFNAVVPAQGELAAVLFLEAGDPADLAAAVAGVVGVEHAVFLEVAGARVRGVPEAVAPPGETSPAHYLRFALDPGQQAAVLSGAGIAIGADHPNLTVVVQLDAEQREAIAADL